MADFTDSLVMKVESSSKTAGVGIRKLITDLKDLNSAMEITEDGAMDIATKLKNIGADLSKTKLSGITVSDSKTILKYKDELKNVVTVTQKGTGENQKFTASYRQLNKEVDKSDGIFKDLTSGLTGSVIKLKALYYGVKTLITKSIDFSESATAYEEALNLYMVSMGKNAKQSLEWVERFSEALYIDPANVMQYQGSLNSLIQGLGVGADNSAKMSKNLTQLAYDLSSFKNMNFDEAFTKLQSGIAGELFCLVCKGLHTVTYLIQWTSKRVMV